MIVSGYSMDLYCDADNKAHGFWDFPVQFVGDNDRQCRRAARMAGWRFARGGKVYCPKCNKPNPPEPPQP